jgi:hypothetical protein
MIATTDILLYMKKESIPPSNRGLPPLQAKGKPDYIRVKKMPLCFCKSGERKNKTARRERA